MSTVDEIVAAVKRLSHKQYDRLRKKLDRIDEEIWQAELGAVTERVKPLHLNDKDIDRIIMRRRREGP